MINWSPEDLQKQLDAGESVFLKVWKNGCGACKLSVPALERIEAANDHALIFGQISADDYPEILEITETEVLPVFFVFVKKIQKGRFEGFKGLEKLKRMVDECFTA